jgi:hypothetical protein
VQEPKGWLGADVRDVSRRRRPTSWDEPCRAKAAQRDVEVFSLVDCEGLTPLLALFNAATLEKGAESIEAVRKEQDVLDREKRLQIADKRHG